MQKCSNSTCGAVSVFKKSEWTSAGRRVLLFLRPADAMGYLKRLSRRKKSTALCCAWKVIEYAGKRVWQRLPTPESDSRPLRATLFRAASTQCDVKA